MDIIFRHDNEADFLVLWNDYIEGNLASFRFLPEYIDYNLKYSRLLFADYSFAVRENGKCEGICFLPIEDIDGRKQISLAGGYTVSPLCSCSRVEKHVFKVIDDVASELDVKKIMFYLDPLVMPYRNNFNSLLQHGYIDCSSSDGVVDLRQPEKKLWGNLNKSYRPLINGIRKNPDFSIDLFDVNNADYEAHECYRDLHRRCAGRETRPKDTFDRQFDLVKKNQGIFIGLKYRGAYIGFNYFLHFQKTAVYYSGADDPEYEDSGIAIYHPILWTAIEYYNKNNFEFLDFSEPCSYNEVNSFNCYLDRKQLNISRFKRCMGADMVTFYRGINYRDDQLLIDDLECFKDKWLSRTRK